MSCELIAQIKYILLQSHQFLYKINNKLQSKTHFSFYRKAASLGTFSKVKHNLRVDLLSVFVIRALKVLKVHKVNYAPTNLSSFFTILQYTTFRFCIKKIRLDFKNSFCNHAQHLFKLILTSTTVLYEATYQIQARPGSPNCPNDRYRSAERLSLADISTAQWAKKYR